MKAALHAKFTQNHDLKEALAETRPANLVECNQYDPFWSCGLKLHSKDAYNPATWRGKNVLGQLLTELRVELSS